MCAPAVARTHNGDFLLALFPSGHSASNRQSLAPVSKRNNRRNRCFKQREESRAAFAPLDEARKCTHDRRESSRTPLTGPHSAGARPVVGSFGDGPRRTRSTTESARSDHWRVRRVQVQDRASRAIFATVRTRRARLVRRGRAAARAGWRVRILHLQRGGAVPARRKGKRAALGILSASGAVFGSCHQAAGASHPGAPPQSAFEPLASVALIESAGISWRSATRRPALSFKGVCRLALLCLHRGQAYGSLACRAR